VPHQNASGWARALAASLPWLGGLLLAIAVLGIAVRLALPGVAAYRSEIQDAVSGFLGRPIRIESVAGGWAGWTPYLMLRGFTLFDDAGSTPVLRFAEARISLDTPASLRHAALRPRSLVLATPELRLVRLADGAITIERMAIEGIAAQSDGVLRWLLAQPRISLAAERVTWHDRRAGRGPYTLSQAHLDVERRGEIRRLRLQSAAHRPLGVSNKSRRRIDVAIEAKGDLITLGAGSDWQGEVYAEAHGLDARLLLDYARTFGILFDTSLAEASGRVGLRLWGTWRDGQMTAAAGRLRVRSLRVPLGKAAWEVLRGDVWFGVARGEAGETSLTLDRLVLHTPRGAWPETRLRFTLGAREGNVPGSLLAECGYLRVEDVLPFAPPLLSIEHRDLLERAAPGGEVRDLHVLYDPRRDDLYVRADLRGVAADPVPGYALFRGLIATVELDEDRGRLALSGAPLELGGRWLFAAPVPIERLAGEIAWQRQGPGWHFAGHDLRVTVPGFEAHASGHLSWVGGRAPVVDLRVGLSHGDVARVSQYLPGASPRALREWLERALVAGRIVGGGMELSGPLDRFPFDAREGRFRAEIDVERGVLDYTAGWPRIEDISARVMFEGRSLDIRASQGRVLGATLEETHVRVADLSAGEPVLLEIRGRATGPATAGRQFLLDSPLREVAGGAMRQLAPAGSVTVNLMLDLPLGPGQPRLSGQVRFPGNTIRMQDIAFSDVTGEITFTDDRWGARALAARLFGRPVTIDVDGGGGIPSRVRITGRVDRAFLQARMAEFLPAAADPAWWKTLDGETDLEASAEISPAQGTEPDDLTIRSSLEGLAIRAPAPLGKSAGVVRPIEITTRTEAGGRWFRFRYADIARGEILMGAAPERPHLERLVVRLGRDQRVPPAGPRSWVGGSVSHLALSEWQRFLDGLPVPRSQGPQGRPAWPLPLIDIEVADFEALGLHLGHLGIRASRAADAWTVALDGEEVRGTLRVPHSPQVPIDARFERLILLRDGSAGPLEALDPSRLPGLVFECRRCVFGSTALGRVRLKTQPGPEGLSIYDVTASAKAFDLSAVGIWQGVGGASSSRFDVEVRGPDLGTMLGAFGYTLPLEGGKTDLTVQARWPGSPADFTLGALQGTLEIGVLDGRFLEVNQGVGRLFGLLSVHALQRRLRLDFSDIFGKGFAFDRIGGAFSITGGDAYTSDLVMEGPSARIEISGRVGLVRRDYDQWVTVTPSIAGTLPLGAAVLLAQQVFSGLPERINKMLERRYRVTGGWDQPVVTRSDGEQAPKPGAGR